MSWEDVTKARDEARKRVGLPTTDDYKNMEKALEKEIKDVRKWCKFGDDIRLEIESGMDLSDGINPEENYEDGYSICIEENGHEVFGGEIFGMFRTEAQGRQILDAMGTACSWKE